MTGIPGKVGVAISTTGDEHRLKFLETCVRKWCEIDGVHSLFVTVDGSLADVKRVAEVVYEHTGSVFRVGQADDRETRDGHLGVAASKNTGLELLMDQPLVKHLFLCDDDTWPLSRDALDLHIDMGIGHSMVCWGQHRNPAPSPGGYAGWSWPRGVLLYTRRDVVEEVGGMIEEFGPGGHEHVEWSRRIHQAGFTPTLYPTPLRYTDHHAMGAAGFWHAEDMPRAREPFGNYRIRKQRLTSVRRTSKDWPRIEEIMAARDGDTSFVPYRAQMNGRASATLYDNARA